MRRTIGIAFVAGAMALAAPAMAIMLQVGMPEMVNTSTDIVRASVVKMNSYWATDRHSIRTDVTIRVAETWKGSLGAAAPVTLTMQGGKVGDISEQVEDQPDLRPGQDVVLFMQAPATPAGTFRLTNDFQGHYIVQGNDVLSPQLEKMRLIDLRTKVQRLAITPGH